MIAEFSRVALNMTASIKGFHLNKSLGSCRKTFVCSMAAMSTIWHCDSLGPMCFLMWLACLASFWNWREGCTEWFSVCEWTWEREFLRLIGTETFKQFKSFVSLGLLIAAFSHFAKTQDGLDSTGMWRRITRKPFRRMCYLFPIVFILDYITGKTDIYANITPPPHIFVFMECVVHI